MTTPRQQDREMNRSLENLLLPRSLDEVVGNAAALKPVRAMLERQLFRPLLITGSYGNGKSCVADAIARTVVPAWAPGHTRSVFNCVDQNLKKLKYWFGEDSICGSRVLILDEAEQLSDACQRLALTHVKSYADAQLYIFCTAEPDKLIEPLKSRLLRVHLRPLRPSECRELIERAWKDERAVATLGGRSEEDRENFIVAVLKSELRQPRYILNALDSYALGLPANEAVQANMPGKVEPEPTPTRDAAIREMKPFLSKNPTISHGDLAAEIGMEYGTTFRDWRKQAEKELAEERA